MMFVPHRKHTYGPLRPVTGKNSDYEEEEREVGSSERHYEWGEQNISSVFQVPRHYPFVLLVGVSF
jgi:hypothetical protein